MGYPSQQLIARKILCDHQNSSSSRKLWTPFWLRIAPTYVFSGILDAQHQYPIGTKNDVAFPIFEYNTVSKNTTTVSAAVDAFVPNISCELATASLEDRYDQFF
ncbi:hypothetical protein F5B21DRAFT_467478 [Xylaria acuta]|nr:hypothetical protein F5B21DRAFT_467478 [Xylaria acuta]